MENTADLKKSFSRKGYKLTKQRRAILEVLSHTGHLTVEEIYNRVRIYCPEMNLVTVYRNLNLLAELKMISRIDFCDGRARFEAGSEHHHHFFCLKCGRVVDILNCPVVIEDRLMDIHKFRVTNHQFEIYGYCVGCE